jgi:glycosyltransferase involved in cell wall biosynthesis
MMADDFNSATRPPRVSVVVPTRNRPAALALTLDALRRQTLPSVDYEIIVVDDGSTSPVDVRFQEDGPNYTVVRTPGVERSAARNVGARAARSELVVFIDDDITVSPTFLAAHVSAQAEYQNALVVGSIRLPEESLQRPFGRFRQALERQEIPDGGGLAGAKNFCTAANMSMKQQWFFGLEGFDEELTSAEDQDLALRHSARGGSIVFVPEASSIHRDSALELRSYCERVERGTDALVAFCRRHPAWPDNVARDRINGPVRWRDEPLWLTLRKLAKRIAGQPPIPGVAFGVVSLLERLAPDSWLLDRLYRVVLGIHIFRGYRRGLARMNAIRTTDSSRERSESHRVGTADLGSPLR